ncbi:zinc finger protein C11D3.17 [Aspergillus udagawae]|nr:zinc finger protein C11D3.17 [Aspergillus udagawae]
MYSKPFPCRFPPCNASYQRKEHRRRHEARHSRGQVFKCTTCDQQFGRSDTLRRHMRSMHGVEAPARIKFACTSCRNQKARCQGGSPCSNCLRRGLQCSLAQEDEDEGQQVGDLSGSTDSGPVAHPSPTHPKASRSEKERHYISLYFRLFHPYWRFIHQGSFKESAETPLLVQSMVVIGLWLSNEDNAQSRAIALHNVLSSAIHQQREIWDASESERACSSCSWPIPTYQAILLHIIFAILYKDRGALGLDLRPALSGADAELLRRLVVSCKKLGMLYYPNMLARYCRNDLPSYVWVSIEEVKRFNIALYKVCTACSGKGCGTGVLDTTKASSRELRAQDLQFPLPKNTPLWNAVGRADWVSVATEEVHRHILDETLEHEWISKSAHVLEALDAA